MNSLLSTQSKKSIPRQLLSFSTLNGSSEHERASTKWDITGGDGKGVGIDWSQFRSVVKAEKKVSGIED